GYRITLTFYSRPSSYKDVCGLHTIKD
ncbi:hypothetical protein GCK32_021100, partial [Trichostrongylus colubriformis]